MIVTSGVAEDGEEEEEEEEGELSLVGETTTVDGVGDAPVFGLGGGDGDGDSGVWGVGEGLVVTARIIVRVSDKDKCLKAEDSAEQPDCAAMHMFLHDDASQLKLTDLWWTKKRRCWVCWGHC